MNYNISRDLNSRCEDSGIVAVQASATSVENLQHVQIRKHECKTHLLHPEIDGQISSGQTHSGLPGFENKHAVVRGWNLQQTE